MCPGGAGCRIKCNIRSAGTPDSSPLITPAYEEARAFLGSTPEEIHQKFAAIQEMNFAQGDAKLIVSRLSDRELADIAAIYRQSAPAGESDLLRIMARKLDAGSLVRVAKAFGVAVTQKAVNAFSPVSIKQAFARQLMMSPVPLASAAFFNPQDASPLVAGGPAPTSDMTLYEIYLDFRTAPIGSLSPASSISETVLFAGVQRLSPAAAGGATLGYGVHELIEEFDPALDDVIGGTIDIAIDNIEDAATEWEQGDWESGADDLFGTPIGDSGSYRGDWNVGASYEDYEQSTGCD